MKMTMHIDASLLDDVMRHCGFETKAEAVHFALRELDRRSRLKTTLEAGLGMTLDALKNAIYEDYKLEALRAAELPAASGK